MASNDLTVLLVSRVVQIKSLLAHYSVTQNVQRVFTSIRKARETFCYDCSAHVLIKLKFCRFDELLAVKLPAKRNFEVHFTNVGHIKPK